MDFFLKKDAEYDKLDCEFEEAIASGKIEGPRKCKQHSDAGVKRKCVGGGEEDENDNNAGEDEEEGDLDINYSLCSNRRQLT